MTNEGRRIMRLLLDEAMDGFENGRSFRPETVAALRTPEMARSVWLAARNVNGSRYGMPSGDSFQPAFNRMVTRLFQVIAERHMAGAEPLFDQEVEGS